MAIRCSVSVKLTFTCLRGGSCLEVTYLMPIWGITSSSMIELTQGFIRLIDKL